MCLKTTGGTSYYTEGIYRHTHLPVLCSISAYPKRIYHKDKGEYTFIYFCALNEVPLAARRERNGSYYEKYILAHPNWVFAGLYVDEGISGVSRKNRAGFNRMVKDALDGIFDLIITKSISRFARNTVDTLTTIRLLKEKGVEVYFEKEHIFSFDSKGELMLTILSSIAQEESRSISENVKWGCRKRMAEFGHRLRRALCRTDGVLEIFP